MVEEVIEAPTLRSVGGEVSEPAQQADIFEEWSNRLDAPDLNGDGDRNHDGNQTDGGPSGFEADQQARPASQQPDARECNQRVCGREGCGEPTERSSVESFNNLVMAEHVIGSRHEKDTAQHDPEHEFSGALSRGFSGVHVWQVCRVDGA